MFFDLVGRCSDRPLFVDSRGFHSSCRESGLLGFWRFAYDKYAKSLDRLVEHGKYRYTGNLAEQYGDFRHRFSSLLHYDSQDIILDIGSGPGYGSFSERQSEGNPLPGHLKALFGYVQG